VFAGQRLEELGRAIGRADLAQAIRRASGLANGLQQEALASRMAPVGTVLERFPRGVRDRARRLGRSVEFEVTGGEIELDRAILDEIAEPLMHLLNNAVDHGIESPDEREARGKPRTGAVRLGVLREGQNVALEVSDDGRGLDRARLLEVALARGLVAETQLGGLPDEEVNRIATLSGVSTAASVSESSGRGVGLDAVQAAATRLGGVLTIRSVEGSGTAFTLRLPATLAAMRCLLVESWGSRYAIPLGYVREMTWAPSGRGAGESPAVVARGQRVACLPLGEAVGAVRPAGPPEAGALAVVFQVADEPLALWVSRVLGTREIVVRRLHPLKGVRLPFNGVTALGDGSLALLVDAARLASASPLSQAAAGAGPRAGEGSE